MKSKNSNNIVKELISLAYMNFLRLLKTIKNHQIKFLKSCGHCGRSGSTPLPGTKRVETSARFFTLECICQYIIYSLNAFIQKYIFFHYENRMYLIKKVGNKSYNGLNIDAI